MNRLAVLLFALVIGGTALASDLLSMTGASSGGGSTRCNSCAVYTPYFASCQDKAFGSSSATFSGLTLGSGTGATVLGIYSQNANISGTGAAVTVGGVTATQVTTASSSGGLYRAASVPSAGSVVVTGSGVFSIICVAGGEITNSTSSTAYSRQTAVAPNQAQPYTFVTGLSTPANGVGVGYIFAQTTSTRLPIIWASPALRDGANEASVDTGNAGITGGTHQQALSPTTFRPGYSCSGAGCGFTSIIEMSLTWGQ